VANPLLSLAAAAARWLPAPIRKALYRLGPVSSSLRSALNRAAPKGLTEVKVAGGWLAGMHLQLDMQTEKDYWLGTYETDLVAAIQDLTTPGIVVYDIGANIGYISLTFAKFIGRDGTLFAFEPLPGNQERLQKNIELNASSNIRIVRKAVAESSGKREFLVHSSGGMGKMQGSNGRETQYKNSIEVECTSLDDFVFKENNPQPALIKIDIEGGEGFALQGMGRLLEQVRPLLIIELHGEEAAKKSWRLLSEAGYIINRLEKNYPQVKDVSDLDWKSYILARPE
jgi:FkbM family methyltransferase